MVKKLEFLECDIDNCDGSKDCEGCVEGIRYVMYGGESECAPDDEFDNKIYAANISDLVDAFEHTKNHELIEDFRIEPSESEVNLLLPSTTVLESLDDVFTDEATWINAVLIAMVDPTVRAAVMNYYAQNTDVKTALQIWGRLQADRRGDDVELQ